MCLVSLEMIHGSLWVTVCSKGCRMRHMESVALMLSSNITLSLETPAKTFNSQHVCD